jgi:class 3 adenylate cyclase
VRLLIEENPEAPALEKREEDVSVVFLDIAGYTSISETLERSQVDYLVHRYFSAYLDEIHGNGGDVNETSGDGLMVLFRGSEPTGHALRAARTAVAVQSRTAALNAETSSEYVPVLVSIGVNSGHALVGSTRLEGVSGARYTYTASGSITNIAARLMSAAVGGEILVSEDTARRIEGDFDTELVGLRSLKNVSEPVPVHRLLHERRSAG